MANGVELASAYISLSVSTEGIPGQIEKELKGVSKVAEKAGKDLGRKVSDGASSTISGGSMSKALARELGSAGDKASKELLRSLASGHRQAERNATVAGQNYARAMAAAMTGGSRETAQRYEREFRNALNARASSQHFFDEFHRDGVRRGKMVGNLVGKAVGGAITLSLTAATAGLTAAVGGIGYTLFKGFERYRSLDASAKRLGALGKTGTEVQQIMGDINEVVDGTPIALDAATDAATKFITAGMEGEELKRTLTAIADAAGASGTDFATLATIFGQVNNKGKLMGEEIAQLAEHGLNVMPLLREQFQNLPEDVGDAGLKIGDLVDVVEKRFGGMAKTAADTVDGALSQMQTAVARVGANFLSAIFGDPLSTTEGPGGMAQAINRVTEKLDGVNQWVITHKDEIKGYFDGAVETAKDVANAVKEIGEFLVENKELVYGFAAAFVGWKTIQGISSVISSLQTIKSLLGKDIPSSAGTAGGSLSKNLIGPGTAAVVASWGIMELQNQLDELFNTNIFSGQVPGSLAWFLKGGWKNTRFNNPFNDNDNQALPPVAPGVPFTPGTNQSSGTPGSNPLDAFTGSSNPSNANTGGALTPETQAVQDYLRNELGFKGTIGGWRPPDGFNEHSSGKASDVMISSLEQGYALLPNLLSRPGVQYILFDNKQWNPDGTSSTGISSPHTDHLHVKTYKTGGAVDLEPAPGQPGYIGPKPWAAWNGQYVPWKPGANPISGRFNPGIEIDTSMVTTSGAPRKPFDWDQYREKLGVGLRVATGGSVIGPGTGTSDSIPAYLSNGEHVLTAKDVAALGGQSGVYAFRNALHRKDGGAIKLGQTIFPRDKNRRAGDTPGTIGLPDWSTPGQGWGPPPPDWWLKPVDPDSVLFPEWWGQNPWGKHPLDKDRFRLFGFADGGAVDPELLKQLARQGFSSTQQRMGVHGASNGAKPGPSPEQLQAMGVQPEGLPDASGRTEGYIPAGAGFTGPTGGGVAGGFIKLGGEAVKGAIQAAADAGKMAASMGSMGAGGQAAGVGIQIGADIAKRGVDWATDMAGIGIGAVTEILSPFGAPRWLSDVDPTAFIPNTGGGPLALTAAEGLVQGAGPGRADPNTIQHGTAQGAAPGPTPGGAAAAAVKGTAAPTAPPPPATNPNDPAEWLKNLGIFDTGGVLQPNSGAVNLSNRPEYVLTGQQWDTMAKTASISNRGGVTYNVSGVDLNEALRELKKVERRNSGPTMRGKAGL